MYMVRESFKVETGILDGLIASGFKLIRFRQTKNFNNKIEPILWVISFPSKLQTFFPFSDPVDHWIQKETFENAR